MNIAVTKDGFWLEPETKLEKSRLSLITERQYKSEMLQYSDYSKKIIGLFFEEIKNESTP
jgi:hypothetical protein